MNKFVQAWLLYTCFLLPYLLAEQPKCDHTAKCSCVQTNGDKNEYWCIGNTTQVIVEVKFNKNLKIICSGFDKPGSEYLHYLDGIKTIPRLERFILKQCPVPDISFANLFKALNIQSTNEIQFESFLNISDGFKSYHFENLTQVESLYMWSNNITELPESIFRDMSNLKKLYLNNNALRALPGKIFKPVTKLVKLELGSNNLTVLESEVFRYLPDLIFLNIYKNGLQQIPKNTFSYLTKLTSLDLSGNNIKRLDDGVFDDLQKLEFLNLNYNNISYLPKKLFANNRNLKVIRLMKAFSYEMKILPSGIFAGLMSLSNVQMNANNLTDLPANLFQNCYNLTSIFLKSNSLRTLPSTLFKDTPDLKELDISDNQLKYLNGTVFYTLKKLVKLQLEKNHITFISSNIFASLVSLTELDLSRNQLVDFEENTFTQLKNIKTINLSNNNLTFESSMELNYSPFKTCITLETLNLKNNSLTTIFEDWRLTLNKLRTLNLSYNKMKALSSAELLFTSSTNYPLTVNLSNNEIDTIFIQDLELQFKSQCDPPPCTINSELKQGETILLFRNNPIKCDCAALHLAKYLQKKMFPLVYKYVTIKPDQVYCYGPERLKGIPLIDVDLQELQCSLDKVNPLQDKNCPEGCSCRYRPVDNSVIVDCNGLGMSLFPQKVPTLDDSNVELLFANNEFSSLDGLSNLFSMVNVTKLSLSFNKLTNVNDLEVPTGLKTLELNNNGISYLNKKMIEQLNATKTLTSITLHENPWQCNCDTKYLSNFLRSQIKYKLIPNHHNITCKDTGQPIINLSVDDLCEVSLTIIITCVSLGIFGMLTGAAIALFYMYEHEIKVWMFAHKICLWLVSEKELDKNKLYDAFVSFSAKDQSFVVDHLMPQLERNGEHKYKLCIHHRDFVVGEWIPNQIINSIDNSRRTLIVLSPNFLDSVWARMEFRTAHLKAIKERCARVIIILLDDVGNEKLDPELKAYITMNTYVKWGDPLFWEKLRYALPHPQVYSKQRKANVAPLSETELKKQQKLFNLEEIYKAKI